MTGGTMFSGIGAPECAAPEIDWRWCAEIEPFPSAVHKHHYSQVRNLGDITKVNWHEVEPVDLIVAGSPCQAFSVAGKRESLSDARGNLTLELVNAVRVIQPRFLLWENVPGVLSTKDNAFGCFLAALVGADGPLEVEKGRWPRSGVVRGPEGTVAWRVLNAQYFGVAQRRKRVFLVRCPRNGADPAEVLLESPRLLWNPPSRKKERKDTASPSHDGFTPSGFGGYSEGVGSLRKSGGDLGGGGQNA